MTIVKLNNLQLGHILGYTYLNQMKIVKDKISKEELEKMAKNTFGNLVKAVVDIKRESMAVDGELHADEEARLIEEGSNQKDLWGINIYPQLTGEEMIEFDSMVNLRPSQNNLTRGVEDPKTQQRIREVVDKLIEQ